MRKLILTLVLGAGALGLMGALPSRAQAFWVITANGPVNINSYNVGPYGTFLAYNNALYRPYVNPWGFGAAYYYPASYRYAFSPAGMSATWSTRSMMAYNYSPWYGYTLNIATPARWGYTMNAYSGVQTYYIPGVNYTIPAGSYYSGYVPVGYIR